MFLDVVTLSSLLLGFGCGNANHVRFDPTLDVGSGLDASPYRLGSGLTWSYEDQEYVNERFIGTQKAAWNFVANQRKEQKYSVRDKGKERKGKESVCLLSFTHFYTLRLVKP